MSILSIRISCLQAATNVADSNNRHQEHRQTASMLHSVPQERTCFPRSLQYWSTVQASHRVRLRYLFPEFNRTTLHRILGKYIHMQIRDGSLLCYFFVLSNFRNYLLNIAV